MTSKREVLRGQRAWAKASGLEPDTRGYLRSVDDNLFRPLSATARASFEAGSGSELAETQSRPAKMKALHSSAVLAVNFFDYWNDRDARPLLDALGIRQGLVSLRFEAQFPTGLPGNPPNLDVALALDDGCVAGIESKFTEWMTPKRRNRAPFREKYFAGGVTHWADVGLPRCQALADALHRSETHFRYLDAAQLLKHALGLASRHRAREATPHLADAQSQQPGHTRLLYLFFDVDDEAGAMHRKEAESFAARVDDDLEFRAISYGALLDGIERAVAAAARDAPDSDAAYLAYLRRRYVRHAH